MKNTYILFGLLIGSLFFFSCEDDLDLKNPNKLTAEDYFKDGVELQKGVNAMYAAMQGMDLVGLEYCWIHELLSNDVASGGSQLEVQRAALLNGTYGPSNGLIAPVWRGWYAVINRANTVITRAPGIDSTKITETLRNQCVAEAKFFRAWAYYDLVTLWGEVPLYTAPAVGSKDFRPRSSIADIYAQIISDLTAAQDVLPAVLEFDGGRATKFAADALLGKVYLNQGQYAKAKEQFEKIVTSGLFRIDLPYNDNFLVEVRTNAESIFQINFLDVGGWNPDWSSTGDGSGSDEESLRSIYVAGSGWRNLVPSNSFLAEFEHVAKGDAKTDPRLGYSVYFSGDKFANGTKTFTDGNQNGASSVFNGATIKTSWKKTTVSYNNGQGYHGSAINCRIIRYAEVLLAMAECENELGNIPTAIGYLNQVRNRPGIEMPNYPIAGKFDCANKDQVFKAMQHEKRIELGFEEISCFDLLRWKRLGKITTWPYTYTPANPDGYLPIPQNEMDINNTLNQTPGF